MNLTWYLDMLKNPLDTVKKESLKFFVNRITINDGRFALLNRKGPPGKALLDFRNLHLSDLNADVKNLRYGVIPPYLK